MDGAGSSVSAAGDVNADGPAWRPRFFTFAEILDPLRIPRAVHLARPRGIHPARLEFPPLQTRAGEYARVTRDIDLLGRGASSVDAVVGRVREVLAVDVEDGIMFDVGSVNGSEITVETACVGVRVVFDANLSGVVLRMQVDVGFGDAVVPEPEWVDFSAAPRPRSASAARVPARGDPRGEALQQRFGSRHLRGGPAHAPGQLRGIVHERAERVHVDAKTVRVDDLDEPEGAEAPAPGR